MNEIQLHRLDLNLLVTFQALMETRSVTNAAEILGKTPSAVSHALGRLREQLDDPLMVRVGGKMQPSPFALTLIEDVRPILRTIQRVVAPPQPFVPAASTRTFRVALLTMPALMARVYERVNAEAPNVSLEWSSPSHRAYAQVAEGLIDIAMLNSGSVLPDGVSEQVMPPLRVYVFARSGHPALENWCRAEWLKWPHIVVSLGIISPTSVDEGIAEHGMARRIGALVPDFGAIGPLLARTDFLATNLEIALVDDIGSHDLRVLQPPIEGIDPSLTFLWSTRLANDPGQRWLRRVVIECYEDLVTFTESRMAEIELVLPRD